MLKSLLASPRARQAPGEAVAAFAAEGRRAMYSQPAAARRSGEPAAADSQAAADAAGLAAAGAADWEAGTNLACITSFAAAAALACGDAADAPHVLLWLPKTVGGDSPKRKHDLIAEAAAKAAAAAAAADCPPPVDDVFFTRALSAPPELASAPWVTAAFAAYRSRLQAAGFCDPVRRKADEKDQLTITALEYEKLILRDPNCVIRCDVCGNADTILFMCERCKLAVYCSDNCQVKDWEGGTHKSVCFPCPEREDD
jgi:hypothetical protein